MATTRYPDPAAGGTQPAARPTVMGIDHMVSAGHYLAAEAGFAVLEAGGNAVDAGVAAGIALGVVQSELVNVAGVAPILIRMAETGKTVSIAGLGPWPAKTDPARFVGEFGGTIPIGVLRMVVPAAPDAWITALARFGTMRFGEVARAAIRLARDGFVMYPLMAEIVAMQAENYARWPSSAAIYLPGGRPPAVGERFVQADLGASLQFMADEEAASRGSRKEGLEAAHAAFYTGDIAARIGDYVASEGGWLDRADLAAYRSPVEDAPSISWHGATVYGCGPWCQGPALLQTLKLLEGFDLAAMGHNSVDMIHTVAEALKLAFADREKFYTDPAHVPVPLDRLLSDGYAAERRALIRADKAWPDLPPPGDMLRGLEGGPQGPDLDTSYVAVVDRQGNAFSATPSDTSYSAPVVPGTGLVPSSRGSQSWADPDHPRAVAPGHRPRLTPNPALAVRDGAYVMPFGTPGGDVQVQAMTQTFLNLEIFGMDPQQAVEAPRFAMHSFPNSFEPHAYYPGRLTLEQPLFDEHGATLAARGHDPEAWAAGTWRAGGMCLVRHDLKRKILEGAADPRRPSYALGW